MFPNISHDDAFVYLSFFIFQFLDYIEWLAYLVYVVTVTVNIFSGGHDTNISIGILENHESMKIALLMVVIISCLENFSWKFCQLKSL